MLSKQQFAQNKFMRYTAYAIVFGFAIMMFLPGSFSILDVFRGKSSGSGTITVDGVDISQKLINYKMDTRQRKQFVLINKRIWEQWKDPSSNPEEIFRNQGNTMRSRLLDVILWQMNVQTAKDLNYGLSKDKFDDFIEESYQTFLDDLYKGEKQKADKEKRKMKNKEDFISDVIRGRSRFAFGESDNYYRWADKELKERYLHNMVAKNFLNGVLPVAADIEQEYLLDNHKVQMDYALYTYDKHFIKELVFKEKVNEKIEGLKKYYREKREKIDIKRVQFSSEEKAGKAKNDPELFMEEPKDKTKKKTKYQVERRTYYADHDMYKKLMKYKKDDITDPIKDSTNDKIFYIYKLLNQTKPFSQLKENSKEYMALITDYAKDHYIDFKEDYEKQAQKVLKAFIAKATGVKDFRKIKRGEKSLIQHLKVGRTDFFTQTDPVINELSKTKGKGSPESIAEFPSNNQFMKISYALKPGELSSEVLFEDIVDEKLPNKRKVFFALKKVGEKVAKINVLKPKDKKREVERIARSIKRTDFMLLNSLWLPYLKKKMGYKVNFNY